MWPNPIPKLIATGVLGGGGSIITYSISGTVYDADGTTAIPSATVALGAYTAESGVDGTYTITDIPAGTSGSMTCTATGFKFPSISVSAMSGDLTSQDYTANNYASILYRVHGANEIFPFNMSSGTDIPAFVNSNRTKVNGITGLDLQNIPSAVPGAYMPYYDGSNDKADIYTTNGVDGLADIWNPNLGWIFGWAKSNLAWSVSGYRYIANFLGSSGNTIKLYKWTSTPELIAEYTANYSSFRATYNMTSIGTDLFSFGVTWDNITDHLIKLYINGSLVATSPSITQSYTGGLISAILGDFSGSKWNGWMDYITFGFGTISVNFSAMTTQAATAQGDDY